MNATPTAADIEEELLKILTEYRPGTKVRGCHGHLEVYDHIIYERILEPLLKARGAAGLVSKLDDLGNDTSFTAAWNRAIEGKGEKWDCRSLAAPFVRAAILDLPDLTEKLFSEDFTEIDDAILSNLPNILSGAGMKPATDNSLKSWVDGTYIYMRMDDYQPILVDELGQDLEPTPSYPPAINTDLSNDESVAIFGLMSFHGEGIDHEEGQKAWNAWWKAADSNGLLKRGYYDSMAAMMLRTIKSANKMGIYWQQLRQDESVSVEDGPDGLIVYRGAVNGLKRVQDEGQFMSGPRAAFIDILEQGGFSKSGAGDYLDRLAATSSAFSSTVPAGSQLRCMMDPETLYAFDMPDDDMIYDIEKEDALPILAIGTFDMLEMVTHRQRKAAAAEEELAPATPCP